MICFTSKALWNKYEAYRIKVGEPHLKIVALTPFKYLSLYLLSSGDQW